MLTHHQIYKQLVQGYILYNSPSDLTLEQLTRRANIYAVKNTSRKYHEQQQQNQNYQQSLQAMFGQYPYYEH